MDKFDFSIDGFFNFLDKYFMLIIMFLFLLSIVSCGTTCKVTTIDSDSEVYNYAYQKGYRKGYDDAMNNKKEEIFNTVEEEMKYGR